MAVKPAPRDSVGAVLDTAVTNLITASNAAANKAHAAALAAALDQAQRELVNHYMMIGRITAATILSTLA